MDPRLERQRAEAGETRRCLATVADIAGSSITLRRAAGGTPTELTRDEREQLIAAAREGKLVSVLMEAVTFIQRDTPNRNYSRFTPQALQRMAPSFAGMPVLRDHEQGDATARAGRVTESKLEDSGDGSKQIRMVMELTAPWAVELALRGLVDRFSIGWHPTGPTECSICGSEMLWYWCMGKEDHFLGDSYDGQICQLVYTSADGVEVSAVSVPAVTGTGVDDIRAQLAAARAARPADKGHKGNGMKTFATILAALSLGADADEAAAVAGIEKLKTDRDGLAAKLSAVTDRANAAEARLAEQEKAAKTQKLAALQASALAEGRYLPGGAVAKHVEKLAAAGDADGLEAYLADMPKGGAAPIGIARQSGGADPAPRAGEGEITAATLTAGQLKVAKDMGVTPEAYAETLNKHRSGR